MARKEILRSRLAKTIRRPHIPDAVWEALSADGYIRDATDADGYQGLVEAAKRFLNVFQAGASQHRQPRARTSKGTESNTNLAERERARAFSEYLAFLADAHPMIRSFRNRFLQGRTLDSDEALRLLVSPASQILSFDEFTSLGIPLLGHHARFSLIDYDPDTFDCIVEVIVGWPGGLHEATRRCRSENPTRALKVGQEPEYWPNADTVTYTSGSGIGGSTHVWAGSVLDDLRRLAKDVVRKFQAWSEDQSAWFVLTGTAPVVSPLQVSNTVIKSTDYVQGVITLEVEPWVSAQSVLKAYRTVRRRILGGQHRELSNRNVSVLTFVVQEKRKGRKITWRVLMEDWNRLRPDWRYANLRHFVQAYQRAEQKIAAETFHVPGGTQTPPLRGTYRIVQRDEQY